MKKKVVEYTDPEGKFSNAADSATAPVGGRTSRSDEGILSLTNAVFQHILGLNDETRSRMLKIIRNQGQWQDLKVSIRQLSGVAHRRLNDVINMAQDANPTTRPENDTAELGFNPRHEPGEFDHEGHGHEREGRFEFEETRESKKMTFAGYLLNEVTYDEEDLRDPQKRQDIMRLMRAGDTQAAQLVNRANREQKQERRSEIAQEKDPQRSQLMRKRQGLLQQIARIDQQLEAPAGGQQDQMRGGM